MKGWMAALPSYGEKWGKLTENEEHAPASLPNLPGIPVSQSECDDSEVRPTETD